MKMKNYNSETKKIIIEREYNRRKLERDLINVNIANRDYERILRQKWEDDGRPGTWSPEKQLEFQNLIEVAKEEREAIEEKKKNKRKERKELERLETEKRAKEKADREAEEAREKAENDRKRAEAEREVLQKTPNTELEQMKKVSADIGKTKKDLNGNISIVEWLEDNHPDWIDDYALENEGKKAIWQGRITDGFHAYMASKGYTIGD